MKATITRPKAGSEEETEEVTLDIEIRERRPSVVWRHLKYAWTHKFGYNTWRYAAKHIPYFFKCLLWKRYHVIVVETDVPTWIDRDDLLLEASFQILVDFIEREKPHERIIDQWGYVEELLHLYHWWTVERPARAPWWEFGYPESSNKENEYEAEDQAMLMKLIASRGSMWT
jgi:hypothetical protein